MIDSIDGKYEKSVVIDENAEYMHAGGESTDEDNELDGGEVSGLVYYNTSGTAYWWGSSNLSYSNHMHDYTDTRTSPYTDYQYEGP